MVTRRNNDGAPKASRLHGVSDEDLSIEERPKYGVFCGAVMPDKFLKKLGVGMCVRDEHPDPVHRWWYQDEFGTWRVQVWDYARPDWECTFNGRSSRTYQVGRGQESVRAEAVARPEGPKEKKEKNGRNRGRLKRRYS